ncbi:MAG: hybrid sensor histidine kinase/response regulator [bacterium]|nr:hybrid sensor histidine kinase/response regulator [bacterium]
MSERLTVLAIEDDPSDAVLLHRIVESMSDLVADLVVRPSAVEGLDELAGRKVDLVLLDYMLGADTGLTLLQAIRQSGHRCPVVFLTGQGDERIAVEAIKAGASDYLPKDALSESSLRRSIQNALEKARLHALVESHQANLECKSADLERRNREIESFYHTVSHELKTPLTSVLSIVLDGLAGDLRPEQREYLAIARASADQLVRCIDDLVDVARLDTGKLSMEMGPESPCRLAAQVVAEMQATAEAAQVRLVDGVSHGLPLVEVDTARIAQVLRNLFSNAIKFTLPRGTVTIEAETTGDSVAFSVTDTGRGIPKQHCERIFDRLHQIQADDYATAGGLGLGLNICREIVALHGGRISVASEVGVGSTFTFDVPRSDVPAADFVHLTEQMQ